MRTRFKECHFLKYQRKFFIAVNTIIPKNGYFYVGNVLTKLNQIIMILIDMVELGKAKRVKLKKISLNVVNY